MLDLGIVLSIGYRQSERLTMGLRIAPGHSRFTWTMKKFSGLESRFNLVSGSVNIGPRLSPTLSDRNLGQERSSNLEPDPELGLDLGQDLDLDLRSRSRSGSNPLGALNYVSWPGGLDRNHLP